MANNVYGTDNSETIDVLDGVTNGYDQIYGFGGDDHNPHTPSRKPRWPPRRGFLFGPPAWLPIFPEFHDPFALPSANDDLALLTAPQF